MAEDHGPLAPRVTLQMNYAVVAASDKEQKELLIAPGTDVVRIYRSRGTVAGPIFFEKIVLVNDRFPDYAKSLEQRPSANTYIIMEKEYGIQAVRAEEWVSAIPAKEREAKALQIEIGDPLLEILRVSYGLDGKPIEVRTIRINSKDCLYFNERT